MIKNKLRQLYKKKRIQLEIEQIEDFSLAIANQSLKLPIWEDSTYSIFLSIQEKKEINTDYILHILQGKDKNIAVSKSNLSNYTMKHFLLTDNTKIQVSSWGIPEPVDGIEIPETKIDVVFIPLLAFDLQGNRVGYGKGFYDRFLAACRPDVIKVGLSFFEAEENIIPGHENDIALDYCITPKKIYKF